MDITRRQITKIAREVSRFTSRFLKQDGIGTAEFDFIHTVRKNPGITQAGVREVLNLDKGAAARRAASLESKGYLIRKENPNDKRSQLLYATQKAESLKNSKAAVEARYYEWLWQELTEEEKQQFAGLLARVYARNKAESKEDFIHVQKYVEKRLAEDGSAEESFAGKIAAEDSSAEKTSEDGSAGKSFAGKIAAEGSSAKKSISEEHSLEECNSQV